MWPFLLSNHQIIDKKNLVIAAEGVEIRTLAIIIEMQFRNIIKMIENKKNVSKKYKTSY